MTPFTARKQHVPAVIATGPAGLSAYLSLYIDLLRVLAALAVFAGHIGEIYLANSGSSAVFAHAREAVAVFFVLSGMVIAFVLSNKERDARTYAAARISRILPVAVLSLIITIVCDRIGLAIDPGFYQGLGFFTGNSPLAALSYLSFTNQIWFAHIVFGTNEPYWSLGFEVWYYALFGLACFARGRLRVLLVVLAAAIVGPKILMYMPLWLLGVATYKIQGHARFSLPTIVSAAIFLLTLPVYVYLRRHYGPMATTMYHGFGLGQEAVNLAYFHGIGLLVSLNILAAAAIFGRMSPPPAPIGRAIRWLAGASFTLYLVHLPVLLALRAAFPAVTSSAAAAAFAAAATFAIVLLLAELAERRKRFYQRPARRLVDAIADLLKGRKRSSDKAPAAYFEHSSGRKETPEQKG